jgi:undecaprenyl diphosphate synthase
VAASLAHVLIVAGTRREWAAMTADDWQALADELGTVAAAVGCAWLTVRAYEDGGLPTGDGLEMDRQYLVAAGGQCTVIIDPVGDGRERFAEAMRHVPATSPINEKSVASALYEPADVEPDLVLVLGRSTRLPPSLVWELGYGELVFLPVPFGELQRDHLLAAIDAFHGRRRRFGGLDG